MMIWPTESEIELILVLQEYEKLRAAFGGSRVPPSMEVLVEEALRESRPLLQVIHGWRLRLGPPDPLRYGG